MRPLTFDDKKIVLSMSALRVHLLIDHFLKFLIPLLLEI